MGSEPWDDLTHEICSRAVDRVLKTNVDFNTVLEANTGDWEDSTYTGWERIGWPDMRPARAENDETARQSDSHWHRLKDVFKDSDDFSMWGKTGISFEDPTQGYLGDCWIIAAASVVGQDERRIKNIFEIEHLNSAGVYAVKLYIMGIPVTVTVDDYLLFWSHAPNTGGLVYAKPSPDGALWMPILEKAAAKMYGNFEMLSGGWMGPAIQTLTGAPYYETKHNQVSIDELFDYVYERINKGWMITTTSHVGDGSDKTTNDLGVPNRHAFTVPNALRLSNGQRIV